MHLRRAIKYVADVDRAVAFDRDSFGLTLRFASPEWSEFETGGTTLALQAADDLHPTGSRQSGFGSDDLDTRYSGREADGIAFTMPPRRHAPAADRAVRRSRAAETSVSG